jgi:hypothetical protein
MIHRSSAAATTLALTASIGSLTYISTATVAHAGTHAVARPLTSAVARVAGSHRATGYLNTVTTVPHSSDAFAIDSMGTAGNAHYKIAVRHGSQWRLIKAPNLNGRYGTFNAMGAASKHDVWLGGGRQVPGHGPNRSIQEIPTIWRWNGHSFKQMKIPNLGNGADSVSAISASGPNNAWGVGQIYSGTTGYTVALHWNGKKWSQVAIPIGYHLVSVITDGPKNTVALDDAGDLLLWNGTTWTPVTTAPATAYLNQIAQGPGKAIYAIGGTSVAPSFLKFDGSAWSKVKPKGYKKIVSYYSLSSAGRSGWVVAVTEKHSEVLHSTGGKWKKQFAPKSKYQLSSISAATTKSATVIGSTYDAHLSTAFAYAAETKGHGWHSQPVR